MQYPHSLFESCLKNICKGSGMSWPELMIEHMVKGVAGSISTGASNSPLLPMWLEWTPWAYLSASLQKEIISWVKAAFWERAFCNQKPYCWLGELFFYVWWLMFLMITMPGITTYLSKAISLLLESNNIKGQLDFKNTSSCVCCLWSSTEAQRCSSG